MKKTTKNITGVNDYYVFNRTPLAPTPFMKLPPGAIKPGGWLRIWLELERVGMVGHLDEVSPWLDPHNNGWLDPHSKGGGESVPYWLRGYGNLGYILEDNEIIHKSSVWRDAVLNHQQPGGYFGPMDLKEKFFHWPHMIMLECLQSHHEATGDKRVIPFMLKFFRYVDTIPHDKLFPPVPQWLTARGGELFQNIIWTYNRTGEEWLLKLADKVHQRTYNWTKGISAVVTPDFEDCPGAHCVNYAQGFREPAQYYQLTRDPQFLNMTEDLWKDVKKAFGQFSGGMYASDERFRPGFFDPRQGVETCAMVEFMRSAEILISITGNPKWADRCENVAFNSFPAALMPDFRGLHYLTAANLVQLDHEDKRPALRNDGCMFSYSAHTKYHCCQHNVSQGWPYFAEHLWYVTKNNGLAAVFYCQSKVTAKVGDGTEVTIEENTDYPFDNTVRFTVTTPKQVSFPWTMRIPGWCRNATLMINDKKDKTTLKPGSFAVIRRTWKNGDQLELKLPMSLSLTKWAGNKNSVSVNRGPLSYSLKIAERWEKYTGEVQNQGTDKWPEWQVFPASPWNYALDLGRENPLANFEVKAKAMSGKQVFTPENAPIRILAKARKVPEWKPENGLVGLLPQSPVKTGEPLETITLIPMGCARLRITSFPVVDSSIRHRR